MQVAVFEPIVGVTITTKRKSVGYAMSFCRAVFDLVYVVGILYSSFRYLHTESSASPFDAFSTGMAVAFVLNVDDWAADFMARLNLIKGDPEPETVKIYQGGAQAAQALLLAYYFLALLLSCVFVFPSPSRLGQQCA